MSEKITPYRPGSYYYRRALRRAKTAAEAREIGLSLVAEHERLRSWVRELGYIPPKWTVPREEAQTKGWRITG